MSGFSDVLGAVLPAVAIGGAALGVAYLISNKSNTTTTTDTTTTVTDTVDKEKSTGQVVIDNSLILTLLDKLTNGSLTDAASDENVKKVNEEIIETDVTEAVNRNEELGIPVGDDSGTSAIAIQGSDGKTVWQRFQEWLESVFGSKTDTTKTDTTETTSDSVSDVVDKSGSTTDSKTDSVYAANQVYGNITGDAYYSGSAVKNKEHDTSTALGLGSNYIEDLIYSGKARTDTAYTITKNGVTLAFTVNSNGTYNWTSVDNAKAQGLTVADLKSSYSSVVDSITKSDNVKYDVDEADSVKKSADSSKTVQERIDSGAYDPSQNVSEDNSATGDYHKHGH